MTIEGYNQRISISTKEMISKGKVSFNFSLKDPQSPYRGYYIKGYVQADQNFPVGKNSVHILFDPPIPHINIDRNGKHCGSGITNWNHKTNNLMDG